MTTRTIEHLAVARGLRSYDVALPQPWVDQFIKRTGSNPVGHMVMCYDDSIMGFVHSIDADGDRMLGMFAMGVW